MRIIGYVLYIIFLILILLVAYGVLDHYIFV